MKALISRRVLQTPFVVACLLFFVCGGIALLSRSRMSHSINGFFKSPSSIGAEYQSWFEHFLAGFASPSLALIVGIPVGAMLWIRSQPRETTNQFILCTRLWILEKCEADRLAILLVICFVADVVGCASWEFSQYLKRGAFQTGQFSCDITGVFAWFLLLRGVSVWRTMTGNRQTTDLASS